MIKYLPEIYPDESVYSFLSRIYVHEGYVCHNSIAKEVLKRPTEYMDYNFINCFNDNFKRLLEENIDFEDLVLNHTLFKYYSRFMSVDKKRIAYEHIMENGTDLFKLVASELDKKNYYLRYCPKCVEEDRNKYGECYFHIEHQIYRVKTCTRHCCKLVDTNIKNSKMRDTSFKSLEEVQLESNPEVLDVNEISFKVDKYLVDVFKYKYDIDDDCCIGRFLKNRLKNDFLLGRTRKNINKIINEISCYYKEVEGVEISKSMVSEIFRGLSCNSYEICLLAMFEEISVSELCKHEMVDKDDIDDIDERIVSLYDEYKNYSKVARELGISRESVRKVVLGYYR